MMQVVIVLAVGIAVVYFAQLFWRRARSAQLQARAQLAMLQFADLRDKLQPEFLAAASATGKPRGLRWTRCDMHDGQLFATDRVNGDLYALVGVTIGFEAIEGGDMEDVEAVSNLRAATAIFVHRGVEWTTDGRVVFNLEPQQALERFHETLQPLKESS